MSASLTLQCDKCNKTHIITHFIYRLSRTGVGRVNFGCNWYLDGGQVICPDCMNEVQQSIYMAGTLADIDVLFYS